MSSRSRSDKRTRRAHGADDLPDYLLSLLRLRRPQQVVRATRQGYALADKPPVAPGVISSPFLGSENVAISPPVGSVLFLIYFSSSEDPSGAWSGL